jgi:hypothetical protein
MLKPLCRALIPRSISCKRPASLAALALLGLIAGASTARAQYCTASADFCSVGFNDERISRIVFNTIDNSSGIGSGPLGCYTDFTTFSTSVNQGQSYTFTMYNAGPYAEDQAAVWVDWDHNQVFDASEMVTLVGQNGAHAIFMATVSVPANAVAGATRLRARVVYDETPSACGVSDYGETEDYSVVVISSSQGACCAASGACTTTTSAACTGTYTGDSSTCAPSNPCGGACCTGTTCTVTTAAACGSGSVFVDHGVCTPASCTYCTAGTDACGTGDERIGRFTFNSIDNVSASDTATCYSDFTSISTTVFRGGTYAVTLSNLSDFEEDLAAVWIDLNHDFSFNTSTEQFTLTSADAGATFTGNITIPADAPLGTTRLRVRVIYFDPPLPCGSADYGEVEDYSVTVAIATNGACCQTSGACTETLPGDCTGTFSGVGSTCSPVNPCGGACCDSAGNCSVTIAATCASGSSFTSGGVCSAAFCGGACCDAGGVCTLAASSAACVGIFSGAHTSCFPSPCPAPANDACSGAFPLTVNAAPISGTTTLATADYATVPFCTGSDIDVWYSFLAPGAGSYGISMTNATDHSIVVVANCGDTTSLACELIDFDNSVPAFSVPAAGTYFIRIAAYDGDQGSFTVEVHTVNASTCCNDTTGACTLITTGSCAAGTTANAATSCSPTPCIQGSCCNAISGACTLAASAANCAVGTTYQGDGTSCSPNPCPQPPPPANDLCSAAQTLSLGIPAPGSTVNATGATAASCSISTGDVWFDFTAPFADTFIFSAEQLAGSRAVIALYPDCTQTGQIQCVSGDNTTLPFTTVLSQALTSGQNVKVRISSYADITGPFTLVVNATTPPAGVCCRGATCATGFTNQAACDAAGPALQPGASNKFVTAIACNVASNTSPCCYANYNHNSTLEVQDIFDFLNDWFAGKKIALPGGDGTNGTLEVQNIFDFLNAWFAGGCN